MLLENHWDVSERLAYERRSIGYEDITAQCLWTATAMWEPEPSYQFISVWSLLTVPALETLLNCLCWLHAWTIIAQANGERGGVSLNVFCPSGKGVPNLFTFSYHLGIPYCQPVPLLPEQLIWSSLSLFRRVIYIKITIRDQLNLLRFFLFTFHQLVDAWHKFPNRVSKVIMLRYDKNSRLQENLFV